MHIFDEKICRYAIRICTFSKKYDALKVKKVFYPIV